MKGGECGGESEWREVVCREIQYRGRLLCCKCVEKATKMYCEIAYHSPTCVYFSRGDSESNMSLQHVHTSHCSNRIAVLAA